MVVVTHLAALRHISLRMAIDAGILGDRLEIAFVAHGVEVGEARREVRARVEHVTPSASGIGFHQIRFSGGEQSEMDVVQEQMMRPRALDVTRPPLDDQGVGPRIDLAHRMTLGARADALLGVDEAVAQRHGALARVVVGLRRAEAELDPRLSHGIGMSRNSRMSPYQPPIDASAGAS